MHTQPNILCHTLQKQMSPFEMRYFFMSGFQKPILGYFKVLSIVCPPPSGYIVPDSNNMNHGFWAVHPIQVQWADMIHHHNCIIMQ